MSTLIICLLIAVLLPYLAKIPAGYAMSKEGRGYDNHHPRAQQARLQGFGGRAVAAHQNAFESLTVFSTAALTALATEHLTMTVQYLAITHIVCRVIYHVFYLLDLATLRSSIWFVSLGSCIAMLVLCIP